MYGCGRGSGGMGFVVGGGVIRINAVCVGVARLRDGDGGGWWVGVEVGAARAGSRAERGLLLEVGNVLLWEWEGGLLVVPSRGGWAWCWGSGRAGRFHLAH